MEIEKSEHWANKWIIMRQFIGHSAMTSECISFVCWLFTCRIGELRIRCASMINCDLELFGRAMNLSKIQMNEAFYKMEIPTHTWHTHNAHICTSSSRHYILLMKTLQINLMTFTGFIKASNVLYINISERSHPLNRIWSINPLIDAWEGDTRLQQHKFEQHALTPNANGIISSLMKLADDVLKDEYKRGRGTPLCGKISKFNIPFSMLCNSSIHFDKWSIRHADCEDAAHHRYDAYVYLVSTKYIRFKAVFLH